MGRDGMDKLTEAFRNATASNGAPYEAIQLEKPASPRASSDRRLLAPNKDLEAGRRPSYESDNEPSEEEKPMTGASPPLQPRGSTRPLQKEGTSASFLFWVITNIVATLIIILANKQILSNPTLKGAPTLFVAYHFALTALTLHIASSSLLGAFERKPISPLAIAPLVVVFAAHTVVTNASLVRLLSLFAALLPQANA